MDLQSTVVGGSGTLISSTVAARGSLRTPVVLIVITMTISCGEGVGVVILSWEHLCEAQSMMLPSLMVGV